MRKLNIKTISIKDKNEIRKIIMKKLLLLCNLPIEYTVHYAIEIRSLVQTCMMLKLFCLEIFHRVRYTVYLKKVYKYIRYRYLHYYNSVKMHAFIYIECVYTYRIYACV
jgi:hypothetical protein